MTTTTKVTFVTTGTDCASVIAESAKWDSYISAMCDKMTGERKMEWTKHDGGEPPVHGNEYVQVKFRSGLESGVIPSSGVQWEHGYRGIKEHRADVVAYRVL